MQINFFIIYNIICYFKNATIILYFSQMRHWIPYSVSCELRGQTCGIQSYGIAAIGCLNDAHSVPQLFSVSSDFILTLEYNISPFLFPSLSLSLSLPHTHLFINSLTDTLIIID